jgi:hypothetical protein
MQTWSGKRHAPYSNQRPVRAATCAGAWCAAARSGSIENYAVRMHSGARRENVAICAIATPRRTPGPRLVFDQCCKVEMMTGVRLLEPVSGLRGDRGPSLP